MVDTLNHQFNLPNASHWYAGENQFPIAYIENEHGTAKVSLYGAHLLEWQPHGTQPVIWLSEQAVFAEGTAIRGGIPIIFPWFGAHPTDSTQPAHGSVRTEWWEPVTAETTPTGATRLHLRLNRPTDQLDVIYEIGNTLTTTFTIHNRSTDPLPFTTALHTYFSVGDIRQTTISGLEHVKYDDTVHGYGGLHTQIGSIAFTDETDRIYVETDDTVTINDPVFGRRLIVSKKNSNTTVVWNPGEHLLKSQMSKTAWEQFVCVEAVRRGDDSVLLPPSQSFTYSQTVAVESVQ